MINLVFAGESLTKLAAGFRDVSLESFALLLARPVRVRRRDWRLLVESVHLPSDTQYEVRSEIRAGATASFRLPIEKRAHLEGLSLVYCHSHPGERGRPVFSDFDDQAEGPLSRYSASRVPTVPHLALLIGAEGYRARVLGCREEAEIWEIGRVIAHHSPIGELAIGTVHDRQIRAFGEEGQRAIQGLRVAIIGLGGTGSVIAQQLAHLGVRYFLLIDPDDVDETSLNRLVGATRRDIGRPKVQVARRTIRRIAPDAFVAAVKGDVLAKKVGLRLKDVDVVFCCTDSHGSRHFLNQLAYQYYLPVFDMGVVINVHEGRITHIDGRVQMLASGLGCLVCRDGILSPDQVRWDLSSQAQRQADPYFLGQAGVKQPAVISLNSTAASLAVTMFLSAVAGVPADARSQMIRGIPGVVRALDAEPLTGCINCSSEGLLGRGDSCPLPARAD